MLLHFDHNAGQILLARRTPDGGIMCRLHKGPGQVFVAVFLIALTFFLIVAGPLGWDFPAVRSQVAHIRKSLNGTNLQHDG